MVTMGEFKLMLLEKSQGRTQLPSDPKLAERIFAGMKRIAKVTVPLRLVIIVEDWEDVTKSRNIIRRVEENVGIRMPKRPSIDESDIDMDEELLDALALYVMAGLERSNAKVYMGMFREEIDLNNDRLIETELLNSTNEDEGAEAWV